MLEDLRAGFVDCLPDFSCQPAADLVPLCVTSCKHGQREDQSVQVNNDNNKLMKTLQDAMREIKAGDVFIVQKSNEG